MGVIKGETNIYFKESKGLWAFTIDLGYGPDGKRLRREYTSKNRAALVEKRREKIREVEDGTFVAGSVPTVEAWYSHWLDKIAWQRVRPRVLDNYRSYGRRHIIPHIGKRRLHKLTTDDVRHLHTRMREGGSSDRTVQAVHNTLSRALKDAVREKVIHDNPCERLDAPQAASNPRDAYSLAEARAILAEAKSDGIAAYSRWLTAMMLGARQAECLGLEWDRVDLNTGLIDLSWQVQRIRWTHGDKCHCEENVSAARCSRRRPDSPTHLETRPCYKSYWFTRPKTSASVRLVPIPRPLLLALREWKQEAAPTKLNLVWNDRGKLRDGRADREAWKTLCKRAGVRPLDLHSARHTMVTLLLDAGVSPEVIRQIAGHSTILSTRNYMHVSTEQARRALGAVDLTGE